jgi:hypothetical protein
MDAKSIWVYSRCRSWREKKFIEHPTTTKELYSLVT